MHSIWLDTALFCRQSPTKFAATGPVRLIIWAHRRLMQRQGARHKMQSMRRRESESDENLGADPSGPRRTEISGARRRHCGRHRLRPIGPWRPAAAAARVGARAKHGFHHRRSRLRRGGQARACRIHGRARHLRAPARDGRRRSRPPPLARRFYDEHAAGARRSRTAGANARGVRAGRRRSGFVVALSGFRRLAAGPRRRLGVARAARLDAFAGAHFPHPRRSWRDGRHFQPARQGGRRGAVRAHTPTRACVASPRSSASS